MFLGFRIHHVARKLEWIGGIFAALALMTPGGRSVAKGAAKGAKVMAQEVHQSWWQRRKAKRAAREAILAQQDFAHLYATDPQFRRDLDNARRRRR